MISFTAFFGLDETLLQIVHPLFFLRVVLLLIGFMVIGKRLLLGTIRIILLTIRLLVDMLSDAGVSTLLPVCLFEHSWLFGSILKDILELHQSIPFSSETRLHLIQVLLYIFSLMGSTHLLLEQPSLQSRRRGRQDKHRNHIKIKLPWNSR